MSLMVYHFHLSYSLIMLHSKLIGLSPLNSAVARSRFDREEYFYSTLYELPVVKKILLEGRQSFSIQSLFWFRNRDAILVAVFDIIITLKKFSNSIAE